jgi:ubiquinone/menaquinone biosynthesis C-methylase UbiE
MEKSERKTDQPDEISRVTRSKAEAQATYDRISGWYDLLEGIWEKKSKDLGLQKLKVGEGERVLEIGSGTGYGLLALARSAGESGKVYGIDLSSRMLHLTRKKMIKKGVENHVVLVQGDALQLPFKSALFDVLFMSYTLELFDTPEIPQLLSECMRVLRKSGHICVISLSKAGRSSRMRNLYEWGHRKFPRLLDCRPIFVQSSLSHAGFHITDTVILSLMGLPVEVVLADKTD